MIDPLRIVYVVSRSHSGSTLLDLLVSSHGAVVSVGEAKMFQREPTKLCTCGAASWEACPLWSAVDRRLRERGAPSLGDLRLTSREPKIFESHNRAFFEAVSQVTGKQVLLDSSKDLSRLKRLLASGLPVEVIHLRRHPCGVAFSNLRKGRSDLERECRRYVSTHLGAARALEGRKFIDVRYEALAARPRQELGRIMEWLDLSFEPTQLAAWRHQDRHNFGGNRMRFGSSTDIHVDNAWRQELSTLDKGRILVRTLPARMRGRIASRVAQRLFGT